MNEQYSWILPAAAVVGIPVILMIVKGIIDKGDKAQSDAHAELKERVGKLEDRMPYKADREDMEKRFDRGSEKFDLVLDELKGLNKNISELAGHIGVELAKRPTHDEVRQMFQSPR